MNCVQLVSHRGFHDIHDGTHRPLENTLNSFLTAWSPPLHYTFCEGDITISRDGVLFFFHDDTFTRLLHPSVHHSDSHKSVWDWNWNDIQTHIVLLDNSHPSTLIEVLEGAKRLSETFPLLPKKQMILEFKTSPRWRECMDSFQRDIINKRTDLIPYIRLGMSFDIRMLQRVRENVPIPLVYILEYKTILPFTIEYIVQENKLDGMYLQYHPFFRTKKGKQVLQRWKNQGLLVGIWNYVVIESDGKEWLDEIREYVYFLNTDHF